jgi:hypothetical protein
MLISVSAPNTLQPEDTPCGPCAPAGTFSWPTMTTSPPWPCAGPRSPWRDAPTRSAPWWPQARCGTPAAKDVARAAHLRGPWRAELWQWQLPLRRGAGAQLGHRQHGRTGGCPGGPSHEPNLLAARGRQGKGGGEGCIQLPASCKWLMRRRQCVLGVGAGDLHRRGLLCVRVGFTCGLQP